MKTTDRAAKPFYTICRNALGAPAEQISRIWSAAPSIEAAWSAIKAAYQQQSAELDRVADLFANQPTGYEFWKRDT